MDGTTMGDIQNRQMRAMLNCYEQQLLAARRLARFRVKKRLEEGLRPHDPDPAPQREAFVRNVAREFYDTLFFTGNANPVVEEIRQALGAKIGKEVEFHYPPGEYLQIMVRDAEGLRPLPPEEKQKAHDELWRITRQKVDCHMLNKRPARGASQE